MNGVVKLVTVAATSPLTVRESAQSTPVAAKVHTGSSYVPVVGARVLAVYVGVRYYILGGA